MFTILRSKGRFLMRLFALSFMLVFIFASATIYAYIPIRGIGLVDSYLADVNYPTQETEHYVSYVYDNALAVIACILRGNYYLATEILYTLCNKVTLPVVEKIPYESYNVHKGSVIGYSLNCGNCAWLLQALNIYQKTYQDLYKASYLDYQNKNKSFSAMQQRLADYLLTLQDKIGDKALQASKNEKQKSLENNIAAYVALRNCGMLNPNFVKSPDYKNAANEIIEFIRNPPMWVEDDPLNEHFNCGKKPDGTIDTTKVVDVQALGVLLAASLDSFYGSNNVGKYKDALTWAEKTLRNTKTLYGTTEQITGFDFNYTENPTPPKSNLDTVWLEGTLQMTLAFYKSGNISSAQFYFPEVAKTLKYYDSIPWATNEGDTGFNYNLQCWRAVAPTAWLVFCEKQFNPLILY